jgi:hypothetical protein
MNKSMITAALLVLAVRIARIKGQKDKHMSLFQNSVSFDGLPPSAIAVSGA